MASRRVVFRQICKIKLNSKSVIYETSKNPGSRLCAIKHNSGLCTVEKPVEIFVCVAAIQARDVDTTNKRKADLCTFLFSKPKFMQKLSSAKIVCDNLALSPFLLIILFLNLSLRVTLMFMETAAVKVASSVFNVLLREAPI